MKFSERQRIAEERWTVWSAVSDSSERARVAFMAGVHMGIAAAERPASSESDDHG